MPPAAPRSELEALYLSDPTAVHDQILRALRCPAAIARWRDAREKHAACDLVVIGYFDTSSARGAVDVRILTVEEAARFIDAKFAECNAHGDHLEDLRARSERGESTYATIIRYGRELSVELIAAVAPSSFKGSA